MLQEEIENLKEKINKIIYPICPAIDKKTKVEQDFFFTAVRTDAGRSLPPYYLIYFLFVDLLSYRNLGQSEKTSWSVPIDYNGTVYLLEHRKFGMGLFATNQDVQENNCKEIVKKITNAIKTAQPYFEFIAKEASKRSDLNVLNHSLRLHERYLFLKRQYKEKINEAAKRKDEKTRIQYSKNSWGIETPYYELKNQAEWLAISTIDAFFSLTEHIFIHAAVLKGQLVTGEEVANLADKDWASKFKSCLDITDPKIKKHYDQLVQIKRQIRNYIAHGAFGKNGEAFQIHSHAGAVPLIMPHQKGDSRFSMGNGTSFEEEEAILAIEEFMSFYWDSQNLPEIIYIQSNLPTILPYTTDSTYARAMKSVADMLIFVEYLTELHDNAANMDW
ncbi:hypothetical protein [Enterobacter asburiae]|uniref:hypothetical protein n=1 Tax=Enterobacter asburiae TaxID=61645 RepID=UPI001D137469|nr:hypothetical protein [Enterobacter asburiae]